MKEDKLIYSLDLDTHDNSFSRYDQNYLFHVGNREIVFYSLLDILEFILSFDNGLDYLLDQMYTPGDFVITEKDNKFILNYIEENFGVDNPLKLDLSFDSERDRIKAFYFRDNTELKNLPQGAKIVWDPIE